jgi:hypothetical protein
MIPKLEQRIELFGFQVHQIFILLVLALLYASLLDPLVNLIGWAWSLMVAVGMLGVPAFVFRFVQINPGFHLEALLYYHLNRPDIYLAGRGDQNEQ